MMNALELLKNRQSNPFLKAPAPSIADLDTILTAAMRVPDHGALKPWYFTLVQGDGLNKLADLFVQARISEGAEQTKIEKAANMPFRAPLIIVVSTKYQQHDKVPEKEQLITAGCCTHAMQMAATALGYGAMWRTGDLSRNDVVKTGLNIGLNQDIVGFLYIGTKAKEIPVKTNKLFEQYVSDF